MKGVLRLVVWGGIAMLVGVFSFFMPKSSDDVNISKAQAGFELKSTCPPGFIKAGGVCKSRNFYMQYGSLDDSGVGGLKTGLPVGRDGFTPQQIDLGRYLFFDPALSGTGTIACATCHQPERGFSDGRARSEGLGVVARSAPSLWNVAYLNSFFWDARAASLEEQMEGPLFAQEEMGNTPENLLNTLNQIHTYRELFSEAFPEEDETITLNQVYTAIAAFESSLISLNSRYDQYAHGYAEALSEQEIEGLNVFRSFVARCAECHTPPLFTNQQIAVIGAPNLPGEPFDAGAGAISDNPALRGGFKIPSLRNIAQTAPYMHSGAFSSLRETVAFYTQGRGHAVPPDEDITLHWHIWEPDLTGEELDRLVDFLGTLTDESFMPQVPEQVPSGLTYQTDKSKTNDNI